MKITKVEILLAILLGVIIPIEAVALPLIYMESDVMAQGQLMLIDFIVCAVLVTFLVKKITKNMNNKSYVSWLLKKACVTARLFYCIKINLQVFLFPFFLLIHYYL